MTTEDRAQARQALLTQLIRETSRLEARGLAEALVRLDPDDQDRASAHQSLHTLLTHETDRGLASE